MRKKVSIPDINSIANTSAHPCFIVNGKCNPTGIQTLANYLSTDDKVYLNIPNRSARTAQNTSFLNTLIHDRLAVYSCLHEELQIMVDTNQAGGKYTATFNSSGIAAEINFYSLTTLEERELQMMLRVK
jgi:hypothetical protein